MKGLIGVVGPTRMDYAKISARLSYVAKGLSWIVSQGGLPPEGLPGETSTKEEAP